MDQLTDLLGKYKNTVLNAAIILVALLICKNIYQKQAGEISSLIQAREAAQKKNAVIEDIAQIQKKYDKFKEIINKKDMAGLMNNITNIAKEYGVKIISFKPLSDRDFQAYINYAFELNITAPSYHGLGKFVSKLENSSDLFYLTTLNINKTGKDEQIAASLTLNTILAKD